MNKQDAERVSLLLEEAIASLGQALHTVMQSASQTEYEAFRAKAADIVADISVQLLDPIHAAHAELQSETSKYKDNLWCYIDPDQSGSA